MLPPNKIKPAQNKWLVLALLASTFAVIVGLQTSSMPVLFKEISGDLNLNLVQIGTVWGFVSLGSIFAVPVGGILCDKLGAKRTIVMIGLISGVTGAMRGLSNGIISLMATTFLWGLISAAIMPAITMAASQSTGRLKQGSAQGWIGIGGGTGFLLGSMISATWISPLLGGWRNVFFVYGAIAIVVSLIWVFRTEGSKPVEPQDSPAAVPFRKVFFSLLRNRNFWMLGLVLITYQGCVVGMQGFLPYYLQDKGWAVAAAGGTLAVYSAVGMIGVIPLTMLSDRVGSRKFCLYLSFIAAIVGVGLLSLVQNWVLWILVILIGVFALMNSALCATMSIETIQIGSAKSGTALGFILGFGQIGRAFAPPIGNSLAGIDNSFGWPFIFWAALAIVGIIILSMIRETDWASRKTKYNVATDSDIA